jgi:hypothetical protein
MVRWAWRCLTAAILALSSCAAQPVNPSFAISTADAELSLAHMAADPKPLERPLVVLSGIYDPGLGAKDVAETMRPLFKPDAEIIALHFIGARTFDQCAQRLVDAVEARFPSADETSTVEVEVIGCSMGGLVARFAAMDSSEDVESARSRKRLRIARLFTISTPHRGAKLAHRHSLDRRVADMSADSPFLNRLNATPATYEIIPYVRLNDEIVGSSNAAPPGHDPIWVCNAPFKISHMEANEDPRILADIARRLRNQAPFSQQPCTPLPAKSSTLAKVPAQESFP